MIKCENVSYAYRHYDSAEQQDAKLTYVLKNINIQFKPGSFVAVLGHNGSGKSTLAKLLNATLLPLEGRVTVDGVDTADADKIYQVRQNVGVVFQNPDNQIVATIVEEDIAFAPENLGLAPAQIRERVDYALNAVGMWEYRGHAAHRLSGGQKQRVAIAGILAMMPKYIVLDEPTAMLDPMGRAEVLRTLETLNRQKGITIIMITHNIDETVNADEIVVLNKGEVYLRGTPRSVLSEVNMLNKVGLDVPQVLSLIHKLRQNGVKIPNGIVTTEQALAAVKSIIKT